MVYLPRRNGASIDDDVSEPVAGHPAHGQRGAEGVEPVAVRVEPGLADALVPARGEAVRAALQQDDAPGAIVRSADDFDRLAPGSMMLAQRYHEPDGPDCKIYCIGDRLFGIRRIWPIQRYEDKIGRPFTLSKELEDIARRCGRVFGIDLYGLDIIMSGGRPYVVDVQNLGSYMGVQDAPRLLADYLVGAARHARRGEVPLQAL